MKLKPLLIGIAWCALVLQTGCYTNECVNFGNGTASKIIVKSAQTGQEVKIEPGKFRKLGHSSGALLVLQPNNGCYHFDGVDVANRNMDPMYYDPKKPVLGLFGGEFDLNLRLEANMALYVLRPGDKCVRAAIPQPVGYPKRGKYSNDNRGFAGSPLAGRLRSKPLANGKHTRGISTKLLSGRALLSFAPFCHCLLYEAFR